MESMDEFHEVCEASSALVTGGGKGTTDVSHTLTLQGKWTECQGTRYVPLGHFLQSVKWP